jgi:hypothetical protein
MASAADPPLPQTSSLLPAENRSTSKSIALEI